VRNLNYQLKQLGRENRDGSHATQWKRAFILSQIANQLHELGYRHMSAHSLKPKHIEALVKHWQSQGISVGTMKNRLAAIRWWSRKVNRQNVVARTNDYYGIPDRQLVTATSKARSVTAEDLKRVRDPHVRLSLELQRVFGLRREEAIKFQPGYADRGDRVVLKASWTKGGKERTIPVRNQGQRDVLDTARRLAGEGSLIPSHRSYIQQLRVYQRQAMNAGLTKLHGLRHAFAQQRYQELTGWQCPVVGGPSTQALNAYQRELDRQVRLTISRELGHERPQITSVYLGR